MLHVRPLLLLVCLLVLQLPLPVVSDICHLPAQRQQHGDGGAAAAAAGARLKTDDDKTNLVLAELDDFSHGTEQGWVFPVRQDGTDAIGDAVLRDGTLQLTRQPGGQFDLLSAEKSFTKLGSWGPGGWVHTQVRFHEMLLGADLYIVVKVGETPLFVGGVNGEQHWKMFEDLVEDCVEKEYDDEIFFGGAIAGCGTKTCDFRAALDVAQRSTNRFDQFRVWSVHWELPNEAAKASGNGTLGRLRVFIDGSEIVYRDLDAAAPAGWVNTSFSAKNPPKGNLSLAVGVFGDGHLYNGSADWNKGAGVRWEHAFAPDTPAIPANVSSDAVVKPAVMELGYSLAVCAGGLEGDVKAQVEALVTAGRLPRRVFELMTTQSANSKPPPLLVPAGDLTRWLLEHPLAPHTTLELGPGEHTLSETLVLGQTATGLRLSGAPGTRITGGCSVPADAWDTNGTIWRANLPAGTWEPGADPPRQMWSGGGRQRRTRARHPNLWNHEVTAVQESRYLFWSAPLNKDFGGAHCTVHSCKAPCKNTSVCDAAVAENRRGFRYNASNDSELLAMLATDLNCSTESEGLCDGLEAVVYHGWTVSRSFVSFIFPPGHSVHLRNGADRPIGFWSGLDSEGGQRYFLENAEALLDSPGEWFVKSSGLGDGGGTLLYMPVVGESAPDVGVVLPLLQELVVVDGASDIAFEGLELSHADWICGGRAKNETCDQQSAEQQESSAVRIRNSHSVRFDRVNITHVGLQALWFEQGVRNATFSRGEISDLGTGAIRVGPWTPFAHASKSVGRRRNAAGNKPEAVHEVSITDSLLTDGGWVFAAGTGLLVQTNTTHILMVHCELSYFSYTAISLGWSWHFGPTTTHSHTIAKNHIHHLGYPRREIGDAMACIYTLGELNGTVVHGNLCHDVRAYRSGGYCLSQDQGSSNVLFESNVCLRTTASPHNTHYGSNLTYKNNVFWGGGWSTKVTDPELIAGGIRTSPTKGLTDRFGFNSNLIGQVDNELAQLFEGNFNASSDPADYNFSFDSNLYWSDLTSAASGDLATASVFGGESARVLGKRNGTWVPPRKLTWDQWQASGQDTTSVLLPQGEHPFANDDWNETFNVQLKTGLGAKIGWENVDTSTAGIRPLAPNGENVFSMGFGPA